jgi:hypothetical protein
VQCDLIFQCEAAGVGFVNILLLQLVALQEMYPTSECQYIRSSHKVVSFTVGASTESIGVLRVFSSESGASMLMAWSDSSLSLDHKELSISIVVGPSGVEVLILDFVKQAGVGIVRNFMPLHGYCLIKKVIV